MSLPDHLLDDDRNSCKICGLVIDSPRQVCAYCWRDLDDLYADAAIQDAKEGKH